MIGRRQPQTLALVAQTKLLNLTPPCKLYDCYNILSYLLCMSQYLIKLSYSCNLQVNLIAHPHRHSTSFTLQRRQPWAAREIIFRRIVLDTLIFMSSEYTTIGCGLSLGLSRWLQPESRLQWRPVSSAGCCYQLHCFGVAASEHQALSSKHQWPEVAEDTRQMQVGGPLPWWSTVHLAQRSQQSRACMAITQIMHN